MALLIAVLGVTAASARNTYSRNVSDLPGVAQTTLKNNFKAKVSIIKIEKDLRGTEYEVVLTDGTEIDFNSKGEWKNVEVSINNKVPDSMVPQAIRDYVKANNQNKKIVGIEKKSDTYEVELQNGVDLVFNRAGKFLRYD